MENYLTIEELARYLSVTPRTIMNMIKQDRIKGVKVAGKWRFLESEVDKVMRGE